MGQKPTPKWILSKIVTISIFWVITLLVLLYASGLRINWQTGRVSGSVSVSFRTQDKQKEVVDLTINGQTSKTELPLLMNQLQSGHYSVTIVRSGAVPWQKSFYLEPGQAELYHAIVFLPETIHQRAATSAETKEVAAKKVLIDENLVIRNDELYRTDRADEELVVRMSEPIDQAFWYTKKTHVIVRNNTTVSMLETDGGTNRTKLFTLPEAETIKLIVPDEKTIIVQAGGKTTVYDLTLTVVSEPLVTP